MTRMEQLQEQLQTTTQELEQMTTMFRSFRSVSNEDAAAMLAHWRSGGSVNEVVGRIARRSSTSGNRHRPTCADKGIRDDAKTSAISQDSIPTAQLSQTRIVVANLLVLECPNPIGLTAETMPCTTAIDGGQRWYSTVMRS
ncbi:hypothetical protein LTS10_013179 [Elasticomyces elasticus]|nr:hypothetical protein LTS10_013179 [Elasticomyces elasticus]